MWAPVRRLNRLQSAVAEFTCSFWTDERRHLPEAKRQDVAERSQKRLDLIWFWCGSFCIIYSVKCHDDQKRHWSWIIWESRLSPAKSPIVHYYEPNGKSTAEKALGGKVAATVQLYLRGLFQLKLAQPSARRLQSSLKVFCEMAVIPAIFGTRLCGCWNCLAQYFEFVITKLQAIPKMSEVKCFTA